MDFDDESFNLDNESIQTNFSHEIIETPTVSEFNDFNAEEDSVVLRKAIKGLGTDERPIIETLCNRSENQRLEIKEIYFKKFQRDLVQDLQNDLSGYFSKTIEMLMKPRAELNAFFLRQALYSHPIDLRVIIEILAEQKKTAIFRTSLAYERIYQKSLNDEFKQRFKGDISIFLDSLANNYRPEYNEFSIRKVNSDLTEMFSNNVFKKEIFLNCICRRSYSHLRHMFQNFQEITRFSLSKTLEENLIEDDYRKIITYFDEVVRIIVSRCEIDMENIKRKFHSTFNEKLCDYIKKNIFGYFCKTLLMLIAESNSIKWSIMSDLARYPIHRFVNKD